MACVSKIVLPEIGFNLPWKAPIAPKVKIAILAFLIASSTAFVAERIWEVGQLLDGFHAPA